MPKWFSGTNCEVSGIASMPNQTYFNFINRVQLLINGTAVWDNVYFIPLVTPIQPLVYFDSTHFNDASQVTVTINAWTNAGATATTSKVATTYNKEHILGNALEINGGKGHLLKGQDAIFNCEIEHHALLDQGIELTQLKPNIVASIPTGTAYYAWTHGTNNSYGDARTNDAAGQWVTNINVSDSITDATNGKIAKQYPPYNFVFLDSCSCGAINSLAVAFGVAVGVDRAFVGWAVPVPEIPRVGHPDDVDPVLWSKTLFQNLNSGKTVETAINDTNTAQGQMQDLTGQRINPSIYGDHATKVHGVYSGSLLAWYR